VHQVGNQPRLSQCVVMAWKNSYEYTEITEWERYSLYICFTLRSFR